jgi:hypothetical protein
MRGLRRRVVYTSPEAPDAELMVQLRRRYRDQVLAFGEYIGRDLAGMWGYE